MLGTNGNMKEGSMQNKFLFLKYSCQSTLTALLLSSVVLTGMGFSKQAMAQDKASKESAVETSDLKSVDTSAQAKKLTESGLFDPEINTDKVAEFAPRASLGEINEPALPGIRDSLITGPAPMAPALSTEDLPSEQLLGRITSEVFQEMADLERGNVFLKLQMQKEQLKNDLEKLKATYRQARLEEIAKREDVVRSRINWWQEQENIRLDMEKKKAEAEAIDQQIAEAEELRNRLRAEALAEKEAEPADSVAVQEASDTSTEVKTVSAEEPVKKTTLRASNIYTLLGITGMKGRLTARLRNNENGSTLTVKEKEKLSSGYVVKAIHRDSIVLSSGKRDEVIVFSQIPVGSTSAEATPAE